MKFQIGNMTCSSCVRTVTTSIQTLDARAAVSADIASRMFEVTISLPKAEIEAALAQDNYLAHFSNGTREGA